jgi:ABC-type nitrate/sulfonate/bicarbonate transport system permease component
MNTMQHELNNGGAIASLAQEDEGERSSGKQKSGKAGQYLLRLIVPVTLLLAWYYVTEKLALFPAALLPSPVKVGQTFVQLASNGELLRNSVASLERIFYANLVALATAIPLGLLMGLYRPVEQLLDGVLTVLRPIPPLAWVPLSILWFGIGATSVVFITFLAAFFAILINTIAGARSIDKLLIRAALTLGAGQRRLMLKVFLPSTLPHIFTGFRIALGASWMSIVAAELVAATSGLGYMISFYRELLRTDAIMVGMFTIGVIGFGMDYLSRVVEAKLLPWRERAK